MTLGPDRRSSAFDQVYRREYGSIALVAGATAGSWSKGEDIAQEAFVRAHEKWDEVASFDRPGAWVRRVAINLALNSRRDGERAARAIKRIASTPELANESAEKEPDGDLWQAVSRLPAKQRAAVIMHYHDGYSSKEIAEVLGSSA